VVSRVFMLVYWGSLGLLLAAALSLVPSAAPLKPYALTLYPMGSPNAFGAKVNSTATPQTLFVPHHSGELDVTFNGAALGADPQTAASQVNRYQSATIVDLPTAALASGQRAADLALHLKLNQNDAGIGPAYAGPTQILRAAFVAQCRFIAMVQLLMPLALAFALIASLFLIFFSSTPLRYFYFLLCLLFNVLLEFEPRIQIFGSPLRLYISYVGTLYLFVLFQTGSHWWNGHQRERRIAALAALGIAAILVLMDAAFGPDAPQTNVPRIVAFALPAILIAVMSARRAVRTLRDSLPLSQAAIAFASLVYTAFLLNLVRLYLPTGTTALFTIHFLTKGMGALAISGLAGVALAYEMGTYRVARRQVAQLSAITAGHHLALDEQSRALKAEIERLVLLEERQRFTRDMHDGIGGQLLSMLLKARSGALDAAVMEKDLTHSINDLRLITASLDASDGTLHDALAGFALRAEDQAKAAGLALEWTEEAGASALTLPPRATLELLRIMQEAVTNIIRHAQARAIRVHVTATNAGQTLEVEISDDGQGLSRQWEARLGSGIRNMRDRAQRLGGTIHFGTQAGSTGTRVMLAFPIMQINPSD
jgi:signal transduction histidine kinase